MVLRGRLSPQATGSRATAGRHLLTRSGPCSALAAAAVPCPSLDTSTDRKGCKSRASTIQPRCSTGTRSARTSTSALSSSGSTCCASSTICIGTSQRRVARGKPQLARGETWLLAVVLGVKRKQLLRLGRLAATAVHLSAAPDRAPWHPQPLREGSRRAHRCPSRLVCACLQHDVRVAFAIRKVCAPEQPNTRACVRTGVS